MGYSLEVYMGAFMRVPGIPKEVTNGKAECSVRCGAKVHKKDRFCSTCGAAVAQPDTKTKMQAFSTRDIEVLSDKFVDVLRSPEYCKGASEFETIWMPNVQGFGQDLTDGDYRTISLLESDGEKEMAKFSKKYKAIIEAIERTHEVKTQVDFGIVVYSY